MTVEEIIGQMVQRIAEQFHPEKIILFGSMARCEQRPDSDVDLLVVVREVSDRRALRVAMRRAVNGMGLSKDIVLLTSEEFERKRRIPGSAAYPAEQEGRVLYAALGYEQGN
jgi:predicted nucleotidyltransferase